MRTYTFYTEDGKERVTSKQLAHREDLHRKVGLVSAPPYGRSVVHAGLEIYSYPVEYLAQNKSIRDAIEAVRMTVEDCPMAFFIPHEPTGVEALNDTDSTIKGLVACNGYGKSAWMWIDILLDIVPCNPTWPIFVDGGVKFRAYRGPLENGGVGLVTYDWGSHISTIWPQIVQRWTPKWAFPDFASGKTRISWNSRPRFTVSDTDVYLLACSQPQTAFESQALHIYGWDEQGTLEKFVGANERVRRRNGRHVFSLTGHRVEGRPDTGAGSFICDIDRGKQTFGHKVRFYHGSIEEVPDFVFSEKQKKAAFKQWYDEPMTKKPPDKRAIREGRARLFGEWQDSAGLVYDTFDPEVHLIDPFPIPRHWTKYRAIDHGRVNPTACLCAAVSPDPHNDIVIFSEYYRADALITENCANIVEMCGNKLINDEDMASEYARYVEKWVKYRFYKTVLDSRSFAKKDENSHLTIGQLYRKYGIYCTPASGQPDAVAVPVVRELLALDEDRMHIQTQKPGGSRLYIFNICTSFIEEIMTYKNDPDKKGGHARRPSERPSTVKDHLMSCLKYLVQIPLRYVEGAGEIEPETEEDEDERNDPVFDRFTGY